MVVYLNVFYNLDPYLNKELLGDGEKPNPVSANVGPNKTNVKKRTWVPLHV